MEDSNFFAIKDAVKKGDIMAVLDLLNKNADPNYKPDWFRGPSIIQTASAQNSLEIIKLLLLFGLITDDCVIGQIFQLLDIENAKEFVIHVVETNKIPNLIQIIFQQLAKSRYQGPQALEIFKYLLDSGMPVDSPIKNTRMTPLRLSIIQRRFDFVSL